MGVEAVHRALALQSLGRLGNDRAFMKFAQKEAVSGLPTTGQAGFYKITDAVTVLEAAGFGFGKQGSKAGAFYDYDAVAVRTPRRRRRASTPSRSPSRRFGGDVERAASTGKLWFLGAGPGAPDLLTLRAARALAAADVVVWGKALMADGLVAEHARPDAELVPWPPATMEDIHAVYDRAAAEGLVVARMLWGDPALFGSVRDEVRQARARGLEYEIVPGISAFNAAAARLEIDLTVAPRVIAAARPDPGAAASR